MSKGEDNLDKIVDEYMDFMYKWCHKKDNHIRNALTDIFKPSIDKFDGKVEMALHDATDPVIFEITYHGMKNKVSAVTLGLTNLHNRMAVDMMYDEPDEYEDGTMRDYFPVDFLDSKELRDVVLGVETDLFGLKTDEYEVSEKVITTHTIDQLKFLDRAICSADLIEVYEALKSKKVSLEMTDYELNETMYEMTENPKYLDEETRELFIF